MELIERDEIRKRADLIEDIQIGTSGSTSKKASKAVENVIKKMRENI